MKLLPAVSLLLLGLHFGTTLPSITLTIKLVTSLKLPQN